MGCFMKDSSYRIIEVYKTLVYMLLALEIAIIIRFNSRITKPSPENVYQLELFKETNKWIIILQKMKMTLVVSAFTVSLFFIGTSDNHVNSGSLSRHTLFPFSSPSS